MIDSRILPSHVLVLRPSGPISKDDVASIQEKVDALVASGGRLAGLMIEADEFPGWKDFEGLCKHFKFVREHHREIPRVAIVSDSRFLTVMPQLARHFVQAEFRHFAAGEREAALCWLECPAPEAPNAIRRGWFPDRDMIWIFVHGRVTTEDYRELARWMEDILAKKSPVSFVIDLSEVEGIDPGAVLADMKFGLTHVKHMRRIALVGDDAWTRRLASLPNPFPVEIRAFRESEEHEAWDWAIS